MHVFFTNLTEIELFLSQLKLCCCSYCGRTGSMIRHGYLYWANGPNQSGIRGWRVRCKKCNSASGGDRTWSLRLGDTLHRRWFSAPQLWDFIQILLNARSIKNAWERVSFKGFPSSLSNTYKLLYRLALCQTTLRTQLSSRGPPPEGKTGVPLFHVLAHLKEVFGNSSPITAYQLSLQKDFLAVA